MLPVALIGAPGSGKGTQGKLLAAHFALPHISTGDMLRDHVQRGTIIGFCVKEQLDKGLLVPDGLLEDLITSRLRQEDCDSGYILDGYPRTLQQAEWYYAHYGHPIAFLLDVPQTELVRRIAARNEGRPDDGNSSAVIERMEEYAKRTTPIIEYYEREGTLYRIDGTKGVGETFEQIKKLLEQKEIIAYG